MFLVNWHIHLEIQVCNQDPAKTLAGKVKDRILPALTMTFHSNESLVTSS
jgi:hypothetical protein